MTDEGQTNDQGASQENSKLFVGNLPWSLKNSDLSEIFSQYGEITFSRIITDKETQKSKGFGFVEFQNLEDAKKAKEDMTDAEINGRTIRIDYAIPKQES